MASATSAGFRVSQALRLSPLGARPLACLALAALAAACSVNADPVRLGGGGRTDSGVNDTAPDDTGVNDTAPDDTGVNDTAPDDTAPDDTGAPDTAPVDTTPPEGSIRIATWNTARFFDRTCDSGNCDPGDFELLPSAGQFEYKLIQVAAGIEAQDPDIMLLQEVESQDCLDALLAKLDPDRWPVAVLGETGWDASVDVAVLARGELLGTERHRDRRLPVDGGGTTQFAREFLEVRLRIDGRPVTVFAAHFKSKADDDPSRRLAEARGAHEIVLEAAAAQPGTLIVLGGDLNDEPGSAPLQAIEAGGQLRRVAADIAPNDWTYQYFDDRSAIDHLFVVDNGNGAYLPGTAFVLRDGSGGLKSSDHASLRADFELPR